MSSKLKTEVGYAAGVVVATQRSTLLFMRERLGSLVEEGYSTGGLLRALDDMVVECHTENHKDLVVEETLKRMAEQGQETL